MAKSEILKDHSISAIRLSMERNLISLLLKVLSPSKPGWKIQREKEQVNYYTGIPTPFMNSVLLSQFNDSILKIEVKKTIEYYKEKQVPFLWWIGPSSDSKKLEVLLLDYGMKEINHRRTGMAFDLRKVDEKKWIDAIEKSNLSIEPVRNLEELEDWSRIIEKCLNYPPSIIEVFRPSMMNTLGRNSELSAYLAYLDGTPVASSSRWYSAGVMGLFNVGTLPEYRGKRFATIMAQAILLEAKKRNYEISTLIATDQGYGVYQKLGYQDIWEWKQYVWAP
jgi:GNAT superfamily N-acetyltransferase